MNAKNVCLALLAFIFISACKKHGNPGPAKGPDSVNVAVSVYTVGSARINNGIKLVAAYSKDGVIRTLADSLYTSTANAITINDTDVYIAGSINGIATYWKNGVTVKLTDTLTHSNAYAITVKGTDIYIAGFVNTTSGFSRATYWKNGVASYLPAGSANATAVSIAVDGADVYIAGSISVPNRNPVVLYWKNGVMKKLTDDSVFDFASAIGANNGNIYVLGQRNYWKNDVVVNYPATFSGAAIAFNGNDVYMAGTGGPVEPSAIYSKNDMLVTLPAGRSSANSIAVNGNDVYVAAQNFAGNSMVWEKGVPVDLGYNFYVYGVSILKH